MPYLSLDLADPDVARWCDRKIAEALGHCPDSRLGIEQHLGFSLFGSNRPYSVHLQPMTAHASAYEAVRLIQPIDANIPAARAALLRALFGRTP